MEDEVITLKAIGNFTTVNHALTQFHKFQIDIKDSIWGLKLGEKVNQNYENRTFTSNR